MDVLHQDALVFEDITFGPEIETVVPGGTENIIRCLFPTLELILLACSPAITAESHLHVPVNFL